MELTIKIATTLLFLVVLFNFSKVGITHDFFFFGEEL